MNIPTLIALLIFGSQSTYVAPEPEPPGITAVITAYTSSVDETDDTPHITASGTKTRKGIAACPRKYPFGTVIEIEGKRYVCEDRMHIRFDNRFDIWMPSKKEALEWGKRELQVVIKENERSSSLHN